MKIVNGTSRSLSVLLDNGSLLSVEPNSVSKTFVATKRAVIAVLNSGKPSELGIIVDGSYEMNITQSITGSTPYCYSNESEAVSKLLGSTKEVAPNEGSINTSDQLKNELKQKDSIIAELQTKVKDLTNAISKNPSPSGIDTDSIKSELEVKAKRVTELETQLKERLDEIKVLEGNNKDLEDKLNEAKNLLSNTEDVSSKYESKITDLNKEIESLKNENQNLKVKVDSLADSEKEISKLKSSLQSSVDKIEAMKTSFNQACEKFRITKNEQGDWIQLTD